jgi:hypothetical protein
MDDSRLLIEAGFMVDADGDWTGLRGRCVMAPMPHGRDQPSVRHETLWMAWAVKVNGGWSEVAYGETALAAFIAAEIKGWQS